MITLLLIYNFLLLIYIMHLAQKIRILQMFQKGVLRLKPNEHIKILTIKLGEGVNIYKDDGEPIDNLTILTYSNINEHKS